LGYAGSYLWLVSEVRANTPINRWRRSAPSKQGLLLAAADALAEHGVELRDITGSSRGDLVAVLGRDRQIHELGPLAW